MYLTTPSVDGFFHATVQPPNGEFNQWSATFEDCCLSGDRNPNQLLGQEVSVEFFCDLVLIGICNLAQGSYGHLSEIKIETTGAVPNETQSWGDVKSLFR